MNTGDTMTLTDSRDNTSYLIGKLADGKCWMLDNLALDLTDDTILNGLDADNTNIDTTNDPGALAALKGVAVRDPNTDPNGKYATAAVSDNWNDSYSYSAPLVNMTNKDTVLQGSDPMAAQALAGNWKVGGYYNYCAASAGSYCYGNGTSHGTSSGNATSSICPKGWRLPTGNTGEYRGLGTAITGVSTGDYTGYNSTAYRTALHLPLSGNFRYGSPGDQGSNGYWWSSTRYTNLYMYALRSGYNANYNTSTIYPAHSELIYYGYSIRCVLSS